MGSTAAEHEGSTVEPDSHRESPVRVSCDGGNINIEVETVLGTAGQQPVIVQTKV